MSVYGDYGDMPCGFHPSNRSELRTHHKHPLPIPSLSQTHKRTDKYKTQHPHVDDKTHVNPAQTTPYCTISTRQAHYNIDTLQFIACYPDLVAPCLLEYGLGAIC